MSYSLVAKSSIICFGATCEDDEDMVKFALLYCLETVILIKEKPTPVSVERVDMLDDIKYFLAYPWGTLSYHTTIKSMRGCPARRSNASHTYNIIGFPIAFMVWGYETIPSLAAAFGIKSSTPRCPRMQNWTISGMSNKNKFEDILQDGFEVVGVILPNVHKMPLIATVHHAGGRKPYDIAPVVEDKPDVDVDTDKVHPLSAKLGAKMRDASTSVEVRLCAMEEKLSIMDRRISSIDSRLSSMDSRESSMDSKLSSMESKLDCLIKLFSSTYNTTGVQCFDEVGGEGVSVGDAHRTCDQRIDHAANHLVPHVSISSSPIPESEHNVKIFTQMSDRKLAGSRRKRRATRTIESSYDCQLLRQKMIRTLLPMSGCVTFDLYRSVPDEVARQYAHFMDTSGDDQTVELFWITVGKDYLRDMECSPK
ncbi:hypothetical protein FNV43_RR05566 [Rhamnella rubrinervis]|uniref:DUF1985 domain-containing protein n=1 Tax=Rhamnella rubrinervis TaxID=2594499 RepID=A0A8K0HN72_9ROSA|nr:hypothetical protein FNV43_RR05566 [Rhamnella rubrinervis]